MATYSYDARDLSGRTVSGIIEADAPHLASISLQEQGLFATRIEKVNSLPTPTLATPGMPDFDTVSGRQPPVYAPPQPAVPQPYETAYPASAPYVPAMEDADDDAPQIRLIPWAFGVKYQDLAVFYRELATLQGAGISMVQGLHLLAEQSRSSRLKAVLMEAATAAAHGHTLSSVMRTHRDIFTRIHVEMIKAGETSGAFDLMCQRLAEYLEREIEIRRKLARETLYPRIVFCIANLVIMLLVGLLGGGAAAMVVVFIDLWTLVGWLFLIWLLAYLYQFPACALVWDQIKLYLPPWWGGVRRRYATARFCRALGTLYAGGVILSRAVVISARACGNYAVGHKIIEQAGALNHGADLSSVLTASGALSPLAVNMARTGEHTGGLDTMLLKVADYLESEADTKAHQYAVSQGVAVSLVAGVVVLIIAIMFFTGYFSMVFKAGDSVG